MSRLNTTYNFGASLRNANPALNRQLGQIYNLIALALTDRVSKYVTNGEQRPHVDPPASSQFNVAFDIGDIYVRTDTDTAWIMTSRTTSEAVTWTVIT
jgi:hypothetical protein